MNKGEKDNLIESIEVTIGIVKRIFKDPKCFAIISLLTKREMSIEKMAKTIGCSKLYITDHLTELIDMHIVKEAYSTFKRNKAGKIRLVEGFFKIDEALQYDFIQIVNSFESIQNVLRRYCEEHKKRLRK